MAHFAVTPNGWSCDVLGLNWLVEIFDRYTRKKAGNRRRLLIVDGHSSHVNMRFIEKCDKLRILLLILPPHSTHRLQPLDVSLFAPLSSFYSTAANTLLTDSLGLINLSKRAFWSLFYPSWQQAFTPTNIASGFAKTGIFPYNPSLLINVITKTQAAYSSSSLYNIENTNDKSCRLPHAAQLQICTFFTITGKNLSRKQKTCYIILS
jgi:hypothetical protein